MSPPLVRASMAAVFVWAIASGVFAWRAAAVRGPDRVTGLEAEFTTLASVTPASGPVGYLEHHEQPDAAEHLLVYYVAQYAFAPRLVVRRTDLEFLLVAQDAARPEGDERLAAFAPIAGTRSGHLLYRRRAD